MISSSIDEIPEVYHTTTEEESALKEDISNLSLAYQELFCQNKKKILYLFYIKGISHKEIADILNINYQSSKNRLSQSLVQLRKIFFLNKNNFFRFLTSTFSQFRRTYNRETTKKG